MTIGTVGKSLKSSIYRSLKVIPYTPTERYILQKRREALRPISYLAVLFWFQDLLFLETRLYSIVLKYSAMTSFALTDKKQWPLMMLAAYSWAWDGFDYLERNKCFVLMSLMTCMLISSCFPDHLSWNKCLTFPVSNETEILPVSRQK